jgi:hypothetical protein
MELLEKTLEAGYQNSCKRWALTEGSLEIYWAAKTPLIFDILNEVIRNEIRRARNRCRF